MISAMMAPGIGAGSGSAVMKIPYRARSKRPSAGFWENPLRSAAAAVPMPVFFIAGGDDPVGGYGAGVRQAAAEFQKHGMKQVDVKIYPLCRHEIHNEINRREVYEDLANWIEKTI